MAMAARHQLKIADFYSTPMPWILIVVTLLPFVALGAWLVMAYYGVEYAALPWNAHSVPPPRLY